jgi:hypothetical protein
VYRQPTGVVDPMLAAPNAQQMWDGRDSWGQQSHPAFEAEQKQQILWMDVSVILCDESCHSVTCIDSLLAIISWKSSWSRGYCRGWMCLVLGSWATTATSG